MAAGELVCVVGPNGAGKSTLINAIAGLLRLKSGSLTFDGVDLARLPPHRFIAAGIAIVPEGRRLFTRMTVRENLEMGSLVGCRAPRAAATRSTAYASSSRRSRGGSTCRPARSPAASSRWWRSRVR